MTMRALLSPSCTTGGQERPAVRTWEISISDLPGTWNYLVKYQNSGLSWYCVRDSNAAGGPEMVFFQTSIKSTFGWNSDGCCAVRYEASFFSAFGSLLVVDPMISWSACASL